MLWLLLLLFISLRYDMEFSHMHCIPCGNSLQDIPQTWSECTFSNQLYTARADTVGAYRVCWSVHWLKSSFNATNHYIYWIYFTFYYSHRWVNEQKTPKQCLNKWVGPRNKKEAKVCTCLTWPLLLAQYQLVFPPNKFPNLWPKYERKKRYLHCYSL